MGHFVKEALKIQCVLIEINAAPKTGPDRRIAHGVMNKEIWETIFQGLVLKTFTDARRQEPHKYGHISTIGQCLGIQIGQNRLTGYLHVERCLICP